MPSPTKQEGCFSLPRVLSKVLLSALVCCFVGCGSSDSRTHYHVEGRVKIDGNPMEKGLITFIPIAPTAGPKASGVVEQGSYVIDESVGPCCGEFLVKIETVSHEIEALAAGRSPGEETRRGSPRSIVAPEYNQESQEKVVVREDAENIFHFEVESVQTNQPRR